MNNFNLTKILQTQVERYRIATVDLLLNDLPEEQRGRAMTILDSNDGFQIVDGYSVGRCVCKRHRKPLATSTVARCVATHWFCRATTIKRTLLLKQEVKRYFPNLFRSGLPAGYYVDANGEKPVLGLLRADVHLTPVSRIWQRSARFIEKHRRQPEFRKLIALNQFEITWLVPTESKANAIRLLASKQQYSSSPVDAHAVSSLLDQLVSLPPTFPDVVGL